MPFSVGCQHLDMEACVGLGMCEAGGADGRGVAVADGVRVL